MSGTIILKNSSVAGKIPLASDLQVGEVAVNTSDGKLFTKHTDNTIKTINKLALVPDGGTGLTTLPTGYIPYGNGTGALSSSANLFTDGTNVGIGTSSPAAKLDLGTGSGRKLNVYNDNTNAIIGFGIDIAGGPYELSCYAGGNGTSAGMFTWSAYNRTANIYAERMRIDSSGNVGIGTSSPASKLHVIGNVIAAQTFGNGYAAGLQTTTPGGANSLNSGISFRSTFASSGIADYIPRRSADIWSGFNVGNWGTEYLAFGVGIQAINDTGAQTTERMRIDGSGNVGIGTTSPTGKLVVVSGDDTTDTSFAKQQLTVVGANQTLASGLGNLQIVTNDAFSADFGGSLSIGGRYGTLDARSVMWAGIKGAKENNTSGSLLGYLAFSTSLVERMRIDSSGNVGIGTSAPNASAILDAQSTTKGVRFPNMTTTQKTAVATPAAGLVVFDTTLAKLCVYSGAAWQTITSI